MKNQYNKYIAPHRNYMLSFAKKLCRNISDAEDITQQSLLKAYIYSENHEINSHKIKSFLSSTVYNTFIDYTRRKKNRSDKEIDCGEDTHSYIEQIEDTFNYDSIIDLMGTEHYILPVLEKLKKYPKLHDSLMYFIQEYSYEEIAELMSTNSSIVKTRMYKARKFVKENISEEFLAKI